VELQRHTQQYTSEAEVEISKRYRHAMSILRKLEDAQAIPATLKAIATVLETTIPAMQELAKEETEETDGIEIEEAT
jgi:hypothetical protein